MTHWLVRIRPNMLHPAVRRDLGNAVATHQRIMRLFPDGLGATPRADVQALFRIDEDRHGTYILAQAAHRPDVTRLPNGYGHTDSTTLTPLLDALAPGLGVRYRIAASAIKRISRTPKEGRVPGKVIFLKGADAETWWNQRAEAAGLHIITTTAQPLDTARGSRRGEDTIAVSRHLFEGAATITDPRALRAAITTGIGRGKAYGCGLLSLAPLRVRP